MIDGFRYSSSWEDFVKAVNKLGDMIRTEKVLWSSFFVTFVPNALLDCCPNHIWSISVNQGCFASPLATSP